MQPPTIPEKEVLSAEQAHLLHLLTADYTPATTPDLADREISSSELQLSIFNHTGEEVPLALINDYMRRQGFHPRATSTLEIVWMLQVRPSIMSA